VIGCWGIVRVFEVGQIREEVLGMNHIPTLLLNLHKPQSTPISHHIIDRIAILILPENSRVVLTDLERPLIRSEG
jgi:hypothetical protein